MSDPLDQLVGIPFRDRGREIDGADCWGLFRLGMFKGAGLELPAYDEHYTSVLERHLNAEMIKGSLGDWHKVPAGQEQRFDCILMTDGRFVSHIALVTSPGRMLHTYQGGASCNDRYRDSPFRERIVAFYRHHTLIKDE